MSYQTYKEYMAGELTAETHQKYYAQFSDIFGSVVRRKFTSEYLREMLKKDKHLNNIPLSLWDNWSRAFKFELSQRNKDINGTRSWSPSMGVCAAKEMARQIAEGEVQ